LLGRRATEQSGTQHPGHRSRNKGPTWRQPGSLTAFGLDQ